MGLFSKGKHLIGWIKAELRAEFDITELGEIRSILGLEVVHNCTNQTICLSQLGYIKMIMA